MKTQKVAALMLSMALTFSTCMPLCSGRSPSSFTSSPAPTLAPHPAHSASFVSLTVSICFLLFLPILCEFQNLFSLFPDKLHKAAGRFRKRRTRPYQHVEFPAQLFRKRKQQQRAKAARMRSIKALLPPRKKILRKAKNVR